MAPLLRVEQAGKKYSRNLRASLRSGAKSLLLSYLRGDAPPQRPLAAEEFWALKDVSFELHRGDVLAILGHNGAGKSTLLKCIAGKLRLDAGRIEVNGKVGHLLEMSAGFDPTLTGRENIQLRGRLMNLRGAQLSGYVSQVAEFAELDEFFDSPVQFYSSGMKARLGFSASSVMTPDILIIDEVLAVGDLSFKLKCYERINELAKNAAVLFVSHSLGQVARMCNRGLYLEKGRVLLNGAPQSAIAHYQEKLGEANEKSKRHLLNPELVNFFLVVSGKKVESGYKVQYGESLELDIDVSKLPLRAQIRILLKDAASGLIMDWNSARSEVKWPEYPRRVRVGLGRAELNPGAYAISILVSTPDGIGQLCLTEAIPFRVIGELLYAVTIQKQADWVFTSGERIQEKKTGHDCLQK